MLATGMIRECNNADAGRIAYPLLILLPEEVRAEK
jgi:hypothetical protein